MQKVCKHALLLLFVLIGTCSYAQEKKQGTTLSIGAELGIPTGDFAESWKLGFGGSLKAAFPVAPDADITLSAGLISFAGKEYTFLGRTEKIGAINLIPLKAGFRYRLSGGFYLEPQLGYSILTAKDSDSDGAFTYAGNLGYLINQQWDISARYEGASKNSSTLSHAGLRLAYSFPL